MLLQPPHPGTFGNLARNKYYGPGFGSVDFSVFKNIPIRERLKIQLRAEMFNLFNRVNFGKWHRLGQRRRHGSRHDRRLQRGSGYWPLGKHSTCSWPRRIIF